MAWQMPAAGPAGQWTAAMGMSQDMNMGSYTPEQWAAMQQQNWQQWTQWQQQYSQWQTQYGDEYAQHLQTGQPTIGMPPLPVGAAAPPAPPPPDHSPPPPPPHENDQPLFGSNKNKTASTPAQRNTSNFPNTKSTTGNNQWSYGKDAPKEAPPTVNTDALDKLAEEEKSFTIQFQKWEKEIERWRKENVDHPDKQSYKEYEERFELCRAQLLERRQQMQLKRARLLKNVPQAAKSTSGNTPTPVPAPPLKSVQNNLLSNYKNNTHQQDFNSPSSAQSYNRSNNKNIDPQDRYESYHDVDNENQSSKDTYPGAESDPTTFLPTSSSGKVIPGLDLVAETSHGHKNQDVIDITEDQHDMQAAPDYSKISKGINNILGDAKIMNILSMVQVQSAPQVNNAQNFPPTNAPYSFNNQNYPPNQGNRNTNNFNQDQQFNRQNMPFNNRQGSNFPMQQNQGMNSQYIQQQGMYDGSNDMQQDQYNDRNASYNGPNNRGGPDLRQGGPGLRQGGFDMRQGGNMRPGLDMGHGGSDMGYGSPDMRYGSPDMRPGGSGMRQGGSDIRQGGPNMRQGVPDMRQSVPDMRQGGPDMRQGGPDMRQGGPDNRQYGPDNRQGGPNMRQGGVDMRQGGPDIRQVGPDIRQGGPNMQYGGPDVTQDGPNRPPSLLQDMRRPGQGNQATQLPIPPLLSFNNRPPLQDMGSQQNVNDYYGPERPMSDNNPVINQPPRPKWVEEPLFQPSIVVDYEHKPLRLKGN